MAARAQWRQRRAATVALILLVGLAGGVVLAAVAGARRTDTAMDRFVAYNRPVDVAVVVNDPALRPKVTALPQVEAAGQAIFVFMQTSRRAGASSSSGFAAFATLGETLRSVRRPLMIDGRLPRADRPFEAVVNEGAARENHLHVGSRIRTYAYTAEQELQAGTSGFGQFGGPAGPAYTFRIVGVIREPSDVKSIPASVVKDAFYEGDSSLTTTPAFLRRYAADLGFGSPQEVFGAEFVAMRLRHGSADLPAFGRAVRRIIGPGAQILAGSDTLDASVRVGRATHLEAIALLVFAALAGLAALLLIGQAVSRQVALDSTDHATLAALGLSRRQRAAVAMVRAAVVGLAGGLLAVVVAVALSPLTPIGLARKAEIQPGLSANVAVLAVGAVVVVLLVVARAAAPAWRATRASSDDALARASVRPGRLSAAVANAGLGPVARTGIEMSLERGRGAAFRTALLGTAVAVAGVVGALTFGDSLHHLVATPREQGWNWDVIVGNPNSQPFSPDAIRNTMTPKLAANHFVGAFSAIAPVSGVTVDGHSVDQFLGVQSVRGSLSPTLVHGRTIRRANEIILARDTLRDVHRRIGQTVTVAAGDRHTTMRIVGEPLITTAGDLSPNLSSGGATTIDGVRRVIPDAPVFEFLVRFKPGVDHRAAVLSLRHDFGRVVLAPFPGGEVGALARVDALPYILAATLVVFAIAALGLTLSSAVRRRRRDLALLKTIGFVRRELSAMLAWQATTLALAALAIGIPIGIALGRGTWQLEASSIGSVSPSLVPLAGVLLVVPATLLVANVLAGWPGWIAGRVHPASALRSE